MLGFLYCLIGVVVFAVISVIVKSEKAPPMYDRNVHFGDICWWAVLSSVWPLTIIVVAVSCVIYAYLDWINTPNKGDPS